MAAFSFAPHPYCGRMAERKLGGEGLSATFWDAHSSRRSMFSGRGPEIISPEITLDHVADSHALRRKPLIWDNLYANDYDGRPVLLRSLLGPPDRIAERR